MQLPSQTSRSGAAAAILVLFGLCIAGSPAQAAEQVDHMALLEQLGGEVAGEVFEELGLPVGTSVHLVPETPHEANWLMARILERELVSRGCTVLSPAALPSAAPVAPREEARPTEEGSADEGAPAEGGGLFDQGEGEEETEGAEGEEDEEDEEEGDADDADASEDAAGGQGDAADGAQEAADGAAQGAGQDGQAGPRGRRPGGRGPRGGQQEAGEQEAQGAGARAPTSVAYDMTLPERGEVVVFRVVECGIAYPWAKRSWLLGPRRFGRMASVRLWTSWLGQPGRQVRGVANAERVHLDAFPGWARSMLEGQSYPFAIEQPASTSLQRIIEPVVVAAIVSSLVYLFYQNQK